MRDDTRHHFMIIDNNATIGAGSIKNTEEEARAFADMLVRQGISRDATVYKLIATYRAEPVVKVTDADPALDGRGR